jgi:7,8-dihydropterin-6-yl-methyl-4-(beta-D-ribofuranosyl)aminobenzene 5'-phosphate synthase
MNYRITVLCENSVGPISGTLGEHGFAALIEPSAGESVLFDTGQGLTLLHNARRMNKNLSAVGTVAISHGHFDHAGGLMPYLQEYGSRRVCGHPGIFNRRYRVKDTGECFPIGIPHARETLEGAGALFDLSPVFRELAPGVHLSGEIPRATTFESGDRGLYCDGAGQEVDPTMDDQSLVLETGKGLVILLGCCHAGMINTLEHIACSTGRRDVYALIGGTHLAFCSQEQMEKTIQTIKGWGISKIAAGHCTGFAASARVFRELPREFHVAPVGYTLEV